MPEFRRGSEAIQESAEPNKSASKYRSYAPTIAWTKNSMEKYVLILTPIDEVITAELHTWIPIGETKRGGVTKMRYEDFLSRKDPSIAANFDRLQDELDRDPITRSIGVAVELEPTFEVVKGRQRPNGFTVKTREYTRRTEDGDEEQVTTANIGLIVQSSNLLWKSLDSLDKTQGPLEDLPVQIIREGMDKTTNYTVIPFPVSVDLSGVIENLEGLSYLRAHKEDIMAEVDSLDEGEDFNLRAAQVVARYLLDTRLEELADEDRYNELTGHIRYLPPPFSGGQPKFGPMSDTVSVDAAPKRPARKAQRQTKEEPLAKAVEIKSEEKSEEKPSKNEKFAALKARLAEENKA